MSNSVVEHKTRGIIFNGDLIPGILDGSKTVTRRVIKPQPEFREWLEHGESAYQNWYHPKYCLMLKSTSYKDFCNKIVPHCPYGVPGDRLFFQQGAGPWKSQSQEERFWSRVIKLAD